MYGNDGRIRTAAAARCGCRAPPGGRGWPAPAPARRGVAVDADGVEADRNVAAVHGAHLAVGARAQHLVGHLLRVERLGVAREHDRAAGVVVAVRVELAHHRQAQLARHLAGQRVLHAIQHQRGLQVAQRLHQAARQGFVARGAHVERAMRLDVLQAQAIEAGEFAQRADLVDDVVDQALGVLVQVAAAEADQVAKAGMRADADAMLARHHHGAVHDVGIAGVKAGGDVGRADQRHDGVVHVIADLPGTKALAHIGVQVYRRLAHETGSPSVCGPVARAMPAQ